MTLMVYFGALSCIQDRDSLGALAEAIKAYGGGVVMITHNKEFYSALTEVCFVCATTLHD